jgi:diguanylate cyclase (GGDEF)-like protein/PAS domain S-box-containing protein
MNSTRPVFRHAFLSILLVLLLLLLNRPEVVLFSRIGFVAWYPAIGVLMALALGVSPRYALLACLSLPLSGMIIYGQPLMSFSNTVDAAGVALCYGGAAYVLRGPLQIDLGLRRRQDVVRYLCVGAVAVAGATTIGVACLIADHGLANREYNAATVAWFLGDAIGLVGIAPFLLIHVFPHVRNWLYPALSPFPPDRGSSKTTNWSVGALVEACAQTLAIFGVCWAMFGLNDGRYGHFYTCFIPVIWVAMRHGIRRVVTAVLALNCGFVVAMHLFPPTSEVLAKVGPFMLVLSAVGLIVGSEVSERHRLAIHLNQQTTYLQSLIQSSPFGIVVLDRQGQVEVVNPAFQRLLLNAGKDLDCVDMPRMLSSASSLEDSGELMQDVLEGQKLQKTTRQQRKDGSFLDLAVYAVPLVIDNEVRGAYMIYQDISEQMRASETARIHAESLSKLVGQLQLRAHELSLLNEMKDLLECCTNPAEASKVVAESVQRLIPQASSGNLYAFESSTDMATPAVHWGSARASEALLTTDSCWCLRRGQAHWSEHSGSGLKCAHLMVDSAGSSLCVPMTAQGRILGVLHLEFSTDMEPAPHSDTTEDWRASLQLLATSVAGQTATALSSLSLRQKLIEQSTRDPLTELFNRRFMDDSLEREMLRATRNSRPLSVMLIDVDHFKRFNDTFGHDAGDHVLQSLADLLRSFFRANDICCRYGGEEFAIILPDSSSQNAVVRANALRTEVKRLNLSYDSQNLGPITISAGVASFPEHGSCAEALLKTADRCLYESKARGRDVVTAAASATASSVQQTSPTIS